MKWYQNKAIIILLLIFFFPVGLFLMWKYTNWDIKVKCIVSAVVAVVVVLVGIFYEPTTVPTNDNSSSTHSTSKTSSVGTEDSQTSKTSSVGTEDSSTNISSNTSSDSKTSSTATSTPTISKTPSETSKPNVTNIELVSVTSPVAKNKMARLEIKGTPNTEYTISVYYGSGASEAAGLEKKIASASGTVVWEWKVGGSTKNGEHRIVISGGGEKLEAKFTTI